MGTTTTPGRPRVEGAREEQILDAAVGLLLEVGYDRLTMDQVAGRARASKATLYRRWSSKPLLVIDAVDRSKRADPGPPPDTGSLRGDLVEAFCGRGGMMTDLSTRLLATVITALQTDPEFADAFRERFIAPRVGFMQLIYSRAVARGEVAPGTDLALVGPALPAILLHRAIVLGEPVTTALVERVVDHIILPATTGGVPAATTRTDRGTPNRRPKENA